MMTKIEREFIDLKDEKQAAHLQRFFKTGKGEYGYGDKFLGIKVPVTRSLVKKYKDSVDLLGIINLIHSDWHEIRLAGFLLLIEQFKKEKKKGLSEEQDNCIKIYLDNLEYGNNWDLVDLIAPNLLGEWLLQRPDKIDILFQLSEQEDSLWHQRVAIVATLELIKNGIFKPTFSISEKYLEHKHDLIHKACGWMLREIGKRGGIKELKEFLNKYKDVMPRTMLRYAIERFPEEERVKYLSK